MSLPPSIQSLHRALARHVPRTGEAGDGVFAASVALVVRPAPGGLELLLIKRAEVPGDPWSGHMACPGGRRDATDADALATAVRETAEEVGIDLARYGLLLGRLDDVLPRAGAPPVLVSSFVFAVPEGTETRVNREVDRALWIPLRTLVAPGAATEYLHALAGGGSMRFPAFTYQEHVIWGLTYRILIQFLEFARVIVRHQEGSGE